MSSEGRVHLVFLDRDDLAWSVVPVHTHTHANIGYRVCLLVSLSDPVTLACI